MSRAAGREIQRTIRSKAGFMTAAALFYLSNAVETEAEPAANEQAPTEQAPSPAPQQSAPGQSPAAPQAPSDATPATEKKSDVPLPTVSVHATRPRAPSAVQAAPARSLAPPPPPAQPVDTTAQSGSGGTGPALGPTPYQVTNPGITRLPVPFLNMPQTVNVIPQAIIQEQNVTTVEQALQYIPGITFSAGEGAQQGDGPIIRGFVARGDLFRDGIRDPGWYIRDAFSIDRIEVYKGPSAFAFGRGATGGAINYVTRLPTGAQYIESTSTVDTANGYREVIDASGKTGNVSGRIQGLWQDINTPTRDQIWTKRWGVAPSMIYDFQQGTKATLYYIYQGEQGVSDYGFTYLPQPAFSPQTGLLTNPGYYGNGRPTPPLPIPRTNFLGLAGGPLGDITETETHIITEKIEHEFDKDLKLSNATRYIDNERFARVTAPRNVGLADNTFPGKPGSPTVWGPPAFPFNYPVEQRDAVESRDGLIERVGNAQVELLDPEHRAGEADQPVAHVGLGADFDGAGLLGCERGDARIGQRAELRRRIIGVAVGGVDGGLLGRVDDGAEAVFTGYSYLESVILDTRDKSILGKHLSNTPRNNFTLWTTYELTPKWTIGGGAIYQSLGWANNTNTAYVPEFWKFDAMISYKVDDKSTVQLNIYNLTDTLYYSQYFGGNVVPASGRWASLTYRTRW
jgi:outer membrane receptor for monomeric catechols